MEKVPVVVIGGGNLAWALITKFRQMQEVDLVGVFVRRQVAADKLNHEFCRPFAISATERKLRMMRGEINERQRAAENRAVKAAVENLATTNFDDIPPAKIYVVAISDCELARATDYKKFPEDAIVLHTAGSLHSNALSHSLRRRRGVLYPMHSFSYGHNVKWSDVCIFVDGETPQAIQASAWLASRMSKHVMRLGADERVKLHVAATFASNFANAMWGIAANNIASLGLDIEVLEPLMRNTMEKALKAENPRAVQTGPASRHDNHTLNVHVNSLEDEDVKEIYKQISTMIWRTSKRGLQE